MYIFTTDHCDIYHTCTRWRVHLYSTQLKVGLCSLLNGPLEWRKIMKEVTLLSWKAQGFHWELLSQMQILVLEKMHTTSAWATCFWLQEPSFKDIVLGFRHLTDRELQMFPGYWFVLAQSFIKPKHCAQQKIFMTAQMMQSHSNMLFSYNIANILVVDGSTRLSWWREKPTYLGWWIGG